MEPQIIDYYNETPHGINVIDKMNEELDELQKKYLDLENKINLPEIIFNSIIFNSKEEMNEKTTLMLTNIHEICNQWVDEYYDKQFFYNWGFGAIYHLIRPNVIGCIECELNKIIDNKHWSYNISHEIIGGLSGSFRGREMPHWNKIYNSLEKNDIKEILNNHIEDYIHNNLGVYSKILNEPDDY